MVKLQFLSHDKSTYRKIEKTKILFLNFEDERFELNSDELDLILQAYMELYPSYKLRSVIFLMKFKIFLIGKKFIRRMYDTISKIFLLQVLTQNF